MPLTLLQAAAAAGQAKLLRQQEELERKAAELERREQELQNRERITGAVHSLHNRHAHNQTEEKKKCTWVF